MDDHFERFPSVEVLADAFEPAYRVKYIECVKESGVVRFVKHEKKIARSEIEDLVRSLVERAGLRRG